MKFKQIMTTVAWLSLIGISSATQAATINKSISLSASVSSPTAEFTVTDLSGSWPTSSFNFNYDETSRTFVNPSAFRIKIKSTADVRLSLSSPAKLVSGLAEIDVVVQIEQQTTAGSSTASSVTVSASPQSIYDSATETGAESLYDIYFDAVESGMTDSSGNPISSTTPDDGTYAGTVNLMFESSI